MFGGEGGGGITSGLNDGWFIVQVCPEFCGASRLCGEEFRVQVEGFFSWLLAYYAAFIERAPGLGMTRPW